MATEGSVVCVPANCWNQAPLLPTIKMPLSPVPGILGEFIRSSSLMSLVIEPVES